VEILHLQQAEVIHRQEEETLPLRLARAMIVLNLLHKEEVAPQQALAQEVAQLRRKAVVVPKALALAQGLAQRIQVLLRVLVQVPAVPLPLQPATVLLRLLAPAQELELAA
jgi:hypothetical protein